MTVNLGKFTGVTSLVALALFAHTADNHCPLLPETSALSAGDIAHFRHKKALPNDKAFVEFT